MIERRTKMSERDVISMQGVDFAYEADAPVLSGVNLRIAEGDFACIVGPNGGGKTTLLRLLLGLLEPSVGTVRVFGASPKQSRARIGYMPQHARLDWQFPVSVMDVVLMGRLGRAGLGPYRKEDREQAGRALAEVGLGSRKKDAFSSLSGGQRQRVLIARALACEPELLLLDEPTSNMDIAAQSDFFRLLDDMNRRLTLVLVSHDVAFVSKFVRTVVCVNRSVVVHATGEITDENLRDLYGREMRAVVHAHGYGEEAGGEPGHLHGPSCDHDHGPTTGGAAHSNAKVKP